MSLADRYRFEPIAVESSGVYGSTSASDIAEIGRRIAEVTREPREKYWLEQRIGLAIQWGNAFSILTAMVRGSEVI